MPDRVTWKSKLALVMASTTLTAVMMGILGEVAVRYRERHRATVPGTMPTLFYRHKRMNHALVRNTDYFGWVHINGQGFRGEDVRLEKPEGMVRIMAVGSSTTFDPNVTSDDRTWPAQLELWLERQYPRRQIEVINAGVPGYTVLDNMIRLQTELFRYQPDVLIFYEGHNDLFRELRSSDTPEAGGKNSEPTARWKPGELVPATPWEDWLTRNSLLYTKVLKRLKVMRLRAQTREDGEPRGTGTQATPEALGVHFTRSFERDLFSFLAVAQSVGLKVVLPELIQVAGADTMVHLDSASRKMWMNATPGIPPERVLRAYAAYNAVIRDAAVRYSATMIPTHSFGLTGASWYFDGDPIHFNDRGAQRMAEQMGQALLESGVFDAVPLPASVSAADPP